MEAPPLYTAHGPWIAAEPAPCPIKEQGVGIEDHARLALYRDRLDWLLENYK